MRGGATWLWSLVGVCLLALPLGAELPSAAGRSAVREVPCPDPKPVFDYRKIDRALKEPKYDSGQPKYMFLAFGPEGKTVMAVVADGPAGGKEIETLYIDLNANHDLTEIKERINLKKTGPSLPRQRLPIEDATFDYFLSVEGGIYVDCVLKDKSWRVPLSLLAWRRMVKPQRDAAPVVRFGGSEFILRNEDFAESAEGNPGKPGASSLGKVLRPGSKVAVDCVKPCFAGSSPDVLVGNFENWAQGGVPGLRAWFESVEDPNRPMSLDIILRHY